MAAANSSLQIYNAARARIASKFSNPKQRDLALQRFDSDPRVQQVRKLAGLAPVSTVQGDVKAAAKQALNGRVDNLNPPPLVDVIAEDAAKNSTSGGGFNAGFDAGTFGLPQMLAAAGLRFLPSALTGNKTHLSYSELLDIARKVDEQSASAHPGAAAAGAVTGSILSAIPIARGAEALALAAQGSRVASVAKAGNILQELATYRKGQKLANAGKIALTGAAAGGAQAAGTGQDVLVGTAEGAVAAPLAAGGLKVGQVLTRPFRDFMRMSSAGQLLSRLTQSTAAQLGKRAADYRAATGAEPTLFELLPQADRSKLISQGVINNQTAEQASNAIKSRAKNLGPEMADVTTKALQPGRDTIRAGIASDLAKARGGALAPGDDDLIDAAMKSPTDMEALRKIEAKAIMEPHKHTPVVHDLTDLLPTMPGPGGSKIDIDPEVSNMIRGAAGSIRLRKPGEPITADEITDMMGTLRDEARKGGIDGKTAQTAADHLQSVLSTRAPDAGVAAQQMADAFAARSRMLEGMKAGQAGKLRNDVQIGTSGKQARVVRNAYDTPEGQAGLTLGHGNDLETNLGGSPDEALRATIAQSRGSTSRELAQNVGPGPAETITGAAQAQDQSAQALASAAKAANSPDDAGTGEGLVQALIGLHPGSFVTTKAWSMRKLMDMTYIPQNRAKTMVEMLFSQDPALTQKAIRAIGNEPNGATFVKALSVGVGQLAGDNQPGPSDSTEAPAAAPQVDQPPATELDPAIGTDAPADPYADIATPAASDEAAPAVTGPDPYGDIAAPADPNAKISPYAAKLTETYANENPDLVALVQRQKAQESHGDQSQVSKKGAVGVMQVMPDTGPIAAKLAGVPWDPNAWKNDPAYNELLGHAYSASLLRKYGGDVPKALAAYNAGPDRVDKALAKHGDQFLMALPSETQDYVSRVGGQ